MPDWRDALTPDAEDYGGYQAGNVPESQPVTIRPDTGGITPSPDNSGLYAIYGRKNPAQAKANRLMQFAGRDMGGKLGQLPGIVATLMAGKAQKEADVVDAAKEADIKAYMDRKEAYDKIKNNREKAMSDAKILDDVIFPKVAQTYLSAFDQSKDADSAAKLAADELNSMTSAQGIATPNFKAINVWDGALSGVFRDDKGKMVTAVYKDGVFGVQDEKGNIVPNQGKLLRLSDVAEYERAAAASKNAGAKSLKDYDLSSISAQLNSLRQLRANSVDLSPEESAQYEALNNEFNRRTGVTVTPPPPPVSEVTQPPAAPAPQAPWTSGSGNSASPVTAPGQPPPPPAQNLVRRASGGRIALFDPNTKAFVRWE